MDHPARRRRPDRLCRREADRALAVRRRARPPRPRRAHGPRVRGGAVGACPGCDAARSVAEWCIADPGSRLFEIFGPRVCGAPLRAAPRPGHKEEIVMHEIAGKVHWHEPAGGRRAGFGKFGRPKTPYDLFMETEGIPVFRDIGVRRVQDLPLAPWKRMGGRGTYVQLHGTEGKWGCYVVEVPGAGALAAEKHLYEEIYLVVEGRGSTEVWLEGDNKRHAFEWQKGSLFSIPVNAMHRIVNASSAPALLLAGTTAPNLMNLVNNVDAIFNCDLPLDNRRSPGWRRVEPFMTGNSFYLWIGQHENGHYSKAHAHTSAAVLICIKGKGYTYTWPENLGITPWKDGNGDQVKRVDYEPVGMVSAAPGGARWYHQHFGASKE